MKKIFIIFLVVIINGLSLRALAIGPSAQCPDGFKAISHAGIYISDADCPATDMQPATNIQLCFTRLDFESECFLAAPANINFTDESGTFSYTNVCTHTPTVRCANTNNKGCYFANTTSKTEWGGICPGKNTVAGVSICATADGTVAEKVDNLPDFDQYSEPASCWCKLLRPGVSSWVFAGKKLDSRTCTTECSSECGFLYEENAAFHSAITSNLM